jgi:hypothetical protein
MKSMFLCKCARQNVLLGIVFLATQVKHPNQQDYIKLVKLMNYLKSTEDDIPKMNADDSQTIKWYIDSSFAMHKAMMSDTGPIITLCKGAIISELTKQKVNAQSLTESKMVAVDNTITKLLWTKHFIEAQGHKVNANIIYQDNRNAMKLEVNVKASSGKTTRQFDFKFFYFMDLIARQEIQVKYCPTKDMISNYMTKPTVGSKFTKFRNNTMNAG